MAQHLLHYLRVRSLGQQDGGEGVPQVVETYPRQRPLSRREAKERLIRLSGSIGVPTTVVNTRSLSCHRVPSLSRSSF